MRYRTLNEDQAFEGWSELITESTGVKDAGKLKWMSTMLQVNENLLTESARGNINESYGSQGPEAVPGMGPVKFPGVGQNHGDIVSPGYSKGSGDMPNQQLAIAMNVAAYTMGLELLPVIPMEFPSMMFGYLDSVYSGNLDQNQEKQGESDIFIELSGDKSGTAAGRYENLVKGDKVALAKTAAAGQAQATQSALYGTFLGKHRINGNPIIKFDGAVALTGGAAATEFAFGDVTDVVPSTLLKIAAGAGSTWILVKGLSGANGEAIADIVAQTVAGDNLTVSGDLVSAVDMHIPEFTKPGATYDGSEQYTSTRERGEDGTQNIVSLRMFSTSVEAGTQEVLAEITRTQLRDLAAYGQDGMSQIYKTAQNELTQSLNKDILKTMFRMGVDSAAKLRNAQGVDFNLFIGDPAVNANKDLADFGLTEFKDLQGSDKFAEFTAVKNAEANSSAENNATRSRRILTRILAASNLISLVGRHGAGDICVINGQLATAIQDVKGFNYLPFENQVGLNKKNLYSIGEVNGGIKVYVDPNMAWYDNRVLVGRRGTDQDPGLKAFIYTLGESLETISETSMAPKVVVTSRYALVPAGFHPQAQYITFGVSNDFGIV